MARRRTAPFVPLLYRRTICVANRKRKEKTKKTSIYYYRWWDDEGKEHRASTGCNLKSDAETFVRDLIRNDGLRKKPQTDITLGKFAEPFYKEDTCPLLKKKQVRNKGYSKDFARWTRGQVDKHLIAHLGALPLSKLTRQTIRNWFVALPKTDNLSNCSCNKQLAYFRQILGVAVDQGLIKENPCNGIEPLPDDSKTRLAFTADEVSKLFKDVWQDEYSYVACIVAGIGGLRISEVRALKPCNIGDDSLEICRSYGRSVEKSTKNGRSREVPITKELHDWLVKLSLGRADTDYIFSFDGKKRFDNSVIYNSLYAATEAAGISREKEDSGESDALPKSFHSFRHTLNSILLSKGVPQQKVMAILGHIDPKSTKTYTNPEVFDYSDINITQSSISKGKALDSKSDERTA